MSLPGGGTTTLSGGRTISGGGTPFRLNLFTAVHYPCLSSLPIGIFDEILLEI